MNIGFVGIEVLLIVFVMTVTFTRLLLPLLQKKHAGQYILEIGPSWHKSKEGTPTMGGIAPFAAVLFTGGAFVLYFAYAEHNGHTAPFILTLLFAVANAGVGFFDDLAKLFRKENAGLTPWQKLVLQFTFATAYTILLVRYEVVSTTLSIPFTSLSLPLGAWWYPLAVLFSVWFVNCANLTDGIDGLASSVGCMIGLGFFLYALLVASLSLTLASAALLGATIGFMVFNKHPAKIFMGDTGSLFFGALAVGCAFISGSPLMMLPFGIIYTLEGLSVVLQVGFLKISGGKRLFRMAPLHHHLEKSGWGEWSIVVFFSLITLIFILMTFLLGVVL